jgi:hypothetical protein
MSNKVDWKNLGIAVMSGAVIGVLIGITAKFLGFPSQYVGAVTGGVTGGLVVLIYSYLIKNKS